LPEWWGLDGVFWAMPASDIISFFVACGMLVWQMKHIKAHNPTEKARG
jgi:Na+-driven multidrug efflux pump